MCQTVLQTVTLCHSVCSDKNSTVVWPQRWSCQAGYDGFPDCPVEEAKGGDQQETGRLLLTPLKQAINFCGKAMRRMENESIIGTIKELEKVGDLAIQPGQAV